MMSCQTSKLLSENFKIGASHAPVLPHLPEAFKSYMNNHPNIH